MTIRIKKDRIEFDGYTLFETSEGFFFSGQITGSQIQDAFQGTVAGITVAGYAGGSPDALSTIDKFPFASEANNVTNVGSLPVTLYYSAGVSSPTHGYSAGGSVPSLPGITSAMYRFPFASFGTAVQTCNVSWNNYASSSNSSRENGYIVGGSCVPTGVTQNRIEKFPFATISTTVNVASMTCGTREGMSIGGSSSTTHGYIAGGTPNRTVPGTTSNIEKFLFATDSTATFVGSLSGGARSRGAGTSSTTSGYMAGGYGNNFIDKFPFATDSNSTNVACLSALSMGGNSGVSSTSNGYSMAGNSPVAPGLVNCLFRHPFSSDTNASCVASLRTSNNTSAGAQD